eukprot:COSAG05_NODE_24597_length_243_cov_606.145833_1_plen_49_part_01
MLCLLAWLQSTIVHWSGFSSTSLDPATARSFAGGGVVFKIEVRTRLLPL